MLVGRVCNPHSHTHRLTDRQTDRPGTRHTLLSFISTSFFSITDAGHYRWHSQSAVTTTTMRFFLFRSCICVYMCVCVYVYIFNHCYFSLTKVPSGADVFFYLSTVHVGNALPLLQLPPSLSHLHVSGHCGTVNTAECCYVDHVCGLVGPKLQLPGSTGCPHRLGLHT